MFEISIFIAVTLTFDENTLLRHRNMANKYRIPMLSTHCSQPPKLEWWAYLIMAASVFAIILLINFFVKKINDTRIDQRCRKMQCRATNQATQVKQSLELGYKESKKKPVGLSFIYDQDDNLKIKDRENYIRPEPRIPEDKYISDWMIVYGRNKSNGSLGQDQNKATGIKNRTDAHLKDADREDFKAWVKDLILLMLDTAVNHT